jgi:Ca-activated chloride channel family protein
MSWILLLAVAVNWPVRYNDGVTAYRSNDFSSAASAFEQATASPDHAVQQRAHYNLGNTCYRLGEAQPPQAQQLWQRAVKSYDSALALDPNDADAKFNRDFVKKKLEELQKQQEQQQKQQQNQQDKKQEQKKDDQQQQEQQKPQEQKRDQQQQPQPQNQQKPEQSKPEEQRAQPDKLDKQQAAALLDNLREEERNWNFFPEVQMKDLKDSGEPAKDW